MEFELLRPLRDGFGGIQLSLRALPTWVADKTGAAAGHGYGMMPGKLKAA